MPWQKGSKPWMNDLKSAHSIPHRLGIFGGTFDPIHRGHLQVAEDVLQQYGLDQIWIVPCAQPPHKAAGALASAQERLEMVRIALKNLKALRVSDVEIQRNGPSYTIDTLTALSAELGHDTQLFFLVGVDAFLEMHTWKSYRLLFSRAAFIVMTRPDSAKQSLSLRELALNYAHQHISDGYTLSKDGRALQHPDKHPIFLAPVTPVAIASTRIREMVHNGQPIDQWVGPGVSDYIVRKGLYR
jgi:nicotinate-nucleotide adenylyltransferase